MVGHFLHSIVAPLIGSSVLKHLMAKRFWLMKSEPSTYSIYDLKRDKTTLWEGIRNYQARNFMMNEMKLGDQILFYHSNAEPPAVVGLAVVNSAAVPDPTQFDPKSKYHDPKAADDRPIWYCVGIEFQKIFNRPLPLSKLREQSELSKMALLQRGQRLSVQSVTESEFQIILQLAES